MGRSCEGMVAIVTGASRGIGKAIATRLAAEGAAVGVVARTSGAGTSEHPGSLDETVTTIEQLGGRAHGVVADLADPAVDRAAVVDEVESTLGPVDILVNNAAAGGYHSFDEWSDEQIRHVLELNFWAPWHLARRVVPGMRERGRGSVLNISSASAILPAGPPFAATVVSTKGYIYGGSKAMLDRWTVSLGAELHGTGVTANALSPQAAARTERLSKSAWFPEHLFEPLDTMAEAALALCTGDPVALTGQVTYSLELLEQLQRPVFDLAGTELRDGWQPGEMRAIIERMRQHRRDAT